MNITAIFNVSGVPQLNLLPKITVKSVPMGSVLIDSADMVEVGNGYYSYYFSTYSPLADYAFICDGGATLSDNERYIYFGSNSAFSDVDYAITNNILLTQLSSNVQTNGNNILKILGLVHQNIQIDMTNYDPDGNLISARVRIWENSEDVGSSNNVLASYTMNCQTSGAGKFTYWRQTLD